MRKRLFLSWMVITLPLDLVLRPFLVWVLRFPSASHKHGCIQLADESDFISLSLQSGQVGHLIIKLHPVFTRVWAVKLSLYTYMQYVLIRHKQPYVHALCHQRKHCMPLDLTSFMRRSIVSNSTLCKLIFPLYLFSSEALRCCEIHISPKMTVLWHILSLAKC